MALANKLGGLLKKATSLNPSLCQAIRCMSSNVPSELKSTKEEERNQKRLLSALAYKSSLYKKSIYNAGAPFTRKMRINRIKLPTHYLEVNYKTLKAVMYYGPNIRHIPQVSDAITAIEGKDLLHGRTGGAGGH